NDIYIFFEIIKQIEPKRIIDIGMFLKRIGNISRQTANEEIARDVQLDAVDFLENLSVPVYEKVYNSIYNEFTFLKSEQTYELAVMLRPEMIMTEEQENFLWNYLKGKVAYVLTDCENEYRKRTLAGKGKSVQLKVDDNEYELITL
ncbi:MAG: hypothetical protein PHW47_10255, partial [Lachnospira sp.]|nr:hypothetical protein [Lachnospira sp.]